MKIKTIKKKKPTKKALVAVKNTKNTPAYYHCLAEKASQGCLKGKVSSLCKECKEQSSQIAFTRQQEIKKVANAYQQLGLSLKRLLTNG